MNRILFLIMFLVFKSVGAQNSDTSYFDYNGVRVEKTDRKMYYYNFTFFENGKNLVLGKNYKHELSYCSEFSDSTFKVKHGNTFWLDKKGDTTDKVLYDNGIKKLHISYEKNIITSKVRYINDSVRYEYLVADGKRVYSKRLYYRNFIYEFQGKDSILYLNNLQYAFREEEPFGNYFILKFKILPWVMGDDGGMNYSLGLEYTLGKIHSFDLTATYLDWNQDMDDSAGNDLPPLYQVRRGVQLGYRYYFQMHNMNRSNRIFISPFVRFSKFQDHYLEGTPTNYFRNETWNYSVGLLFGYCIDGNDNDPFYTEIFAGPQFTFQQIAEGFTENNLSVEREYSQNKIQFRMGMNFCGLLSRGK